MRTGADVRGFRCHVRGSRTSTRSPGFASPRVTEPRCRRTSSRTMARPRPEPPASRARASSRRVNRWKTRSRSGLGDAGAVVGDHDDQVGTVGGRGIVTFSRRWRHALSSRFVITRASASGAAIAATARRVLELDAG